KILNIRLTTEEGRIRADLLEGSLENNPIINPENTLPADIKLIETAHINQEDIIYVDDWEERETQRIKADTIIIELKYESGKPKIINAFIELKDKSRIELSSTILLYKIKNEIKFIYRQIESSFKAPGVHTMIDLPKIIAHKFCVKTNNKIYAYDKSDNKVAPRDIVYRFAVTYPKFIAPPKPVQNLKVYDAKKAENGVILTWVISKDEEQNIKSFAIYYSQSGFIDKKTNDIKNGIYKAVKRIEIDNKPIEIYDIDLNECEFSPIGERCKYKISATKKEQKQLAQFDENTLYYSEIKNMYIYLLRDKSNIIDDQKNRLAVTALNHEGLEMDNNQNYKFIENQNYKIFTPEDDLAPDSSQIKLIGERLYDQKSKRVTFIFGDVPTNNLDGTSINNDLKNCRIYYIKNFDQDKFMDSKINNQQLLTEVNCKELGRPFAVDLSKTNPQTGDIYFFVIVTSDTSDNPKENEFTFKELGTISQKFVIP
ncbi:hypothetical protein HYW99_01290, partial [Candidatus Woesearchaeota archaeon]|nr:hypothetical protein [Candidatus Woesearchaeota archaeon]